MYNGKMIIDLFAGGGGASTGIELALGVSPDVAVNHDPQAIELHKANHPDTKHYIEDVYDVDPSMVCGDNEVALLWMSPDCKHFSKAKGGKPVSCDVRSLAWVGIRWAKAVSPDIIILENVEEFQDWGPLDENNKPIKKDKGLIFKIFINTLEEMGYTVEWRELRASDYGAPTIRKRLFVVASKSGPIVWPEPTHGDPEKYPDREPWKTAGDCIDWSLPVYSIFLTKEEGKKYGVRRPLVKNTLDRIGKGVKKFIIDNKKPYIVKNETSFVSTYYGPTKNGGARGSKIDSPVGTITAGGSRHALCTAFLAQHNAGNVGRKAEEPFSTITTTGSQQQLVKADLEEVRGYIMKMRNGNIGFKTDSPMHTITAGGGHFADVRAYIMKYYGNGEGSVLDEPAHTITTKERFALIEVEGAEYEIVDIAMRMFTPRELYRAQGFPESYKINIMYEGKPLPKTAQVRMCGNSVVPMLAKILVESNVKICEGEKVA